MSTLKPLLEPVLDFLCDDNPFMKEIAGAICTTNECPDREFWLGVHNQLLESTSGYSFDYYQSIAQCHVFCIAAVPDCNKVWSRIVLDELTRRASGLNGGGLSAYVLGSQLGLFQAGKWLQKKKNKLLDGDFLPAMAKYCSVLLGKNCIPVDISGARCSSILVRARQTLDRAVKDYLRPQDKDLAKLIASEIRTMLVELQQHDLVVTPSSFARGRSVADHWLLDALIHGSLDVSHRKLGELVQAALALND